MRTFLMVGAVFMAVMLSGNLTGAVTETYETTEPSGDASPADWSALRQVAGRFLPGLLETDTTSATLDLAQTFQDPGRASFADFTPLGGRKFIVPGNMQLCIDKLGGGPGAEDACTRILEVGRQIQLKTIDEKPNTAPTEPAFPEIIDCPACRGVHIGPNVKGYIITGTGGFVLIQGTSTNNIVRTEGPGSQVVLSDSDRNNVKSTGSTLLHFLRSDNNNVQVLNDGHPGQAHAILDDSDGNTILNTGDGARTRATDSDNNQVTNNQDGFVNDLVLNDVDNSTITVNNGAGDQTFTDAHDGQNITVP